MANEYRFYSESLEVAIGAAAIDAPVRFYSVTGEFGITAPLSAVEVRFYSVAIEFAHSSKQRFVPSFLDEADEIESVIYYDILAPAFLDETLDIFLPIFGANYSPEFVDEGEGFETYGASYLEIITQPPAEWNPYRPDIPNEIESSNPELHHYLKHQAETVRDQHNVTQAGDSTFGAWLLTRPTPNQLYTLGSLGRFYHADYGLIHARYVQFTGWINNSEPANPVGRLATSRSVDWIVTNDFSESSSELVAGICFLEFAPEEGYYGWIVVDGANIALINRTGGLIPAPDTPFVWADTGTIEIGIQGKVIGRQVGPGDNDSIVAAGALYIRVEGLSPASFAQMIADEMAETIAQVTDHETRLDTVESSLNTLQGGVSTLTSRTNGLEQRIITEEQTRARDIASVRNSINTAGDWSVAILAGDNAVRAEFQAADDSIRSIVNLLSFDVGTLLTATAGMDLAGIASQLAGINSSLANIYGRIENFDIDWPVPADGQVLISSHTTNSDGNDVWIFSGLTLNAANVPFTPYGIIAAANVQDAIEELVDEKASLAGATFTGDVEVPDDAYNATTWNGDLSVPTKNAIRDKIETLGGGGGSAAWTLISDWDFDVDGAYTTSDIDVTSYNEVRVHGVCALSVASWRNLRVSIDNAASFISTNIYRDYTTAGAINNTDSELYMHTSSSALARGFFADIFDLQQNGSFKVFKAPRSSSSMFGHIMENSPITHIRLFSVGGGQFNGAGSFFRVFGR